MSSHISPSSQHSNAALRMTRTARYTRILIALFACGVIVASSAVGATGASKTRSKATATKRLPVVLRVEPKDAVIGDKMTITGKNIVKGKNRMVVVFQRPGSKRRFSARANGTNSTTLTVKVPDVSPDLKAGEANLFRVRLISKYGISARWTKDSISPNIRAGSGAGSTTADCDNDGTIDDLDLDDDNDLLVDTIETQIATDRCLPDTDMDGPTDYYEYRIGYDMNGGPVLPYPGRRPYPNPLFADSGNDWDRDTLTTLQEYSAWRYTGRMDRFYSDVDQDSDDDLLTDEWEDEDGDLLANTQELTRFVGAAPLEWLVNDTDGDGLCDGLDDQDHDGPPTPVANADCVSAVPNNGVPGDPDSRIDGDDNIYSNWHEAYYGANGAEYDPCVPTDYAGGSPFCSRY